MGRLFVFGANAVRLNYLFDVDSMFLVESVLVLRTKKLEHCLLFAFVGVHCGSWRGGWVGQ